MKTATMIAAKLPVNALDILVYHSGRNSRITITSRGTGNVKSNAIGKPLISLDPILFSLPLSCSQYTINRLSFSVIMQQN